LKSGIAEDRDIGDEVAIQLLRIDVDTQILLAHIDNIRQ